MLILQYWIFPSKLEEAKTRPNSDMVEFFVLKLRFIIIKGCKIILKLDFKINSSSNSLEITIQIYFEISPYCFLKLHLAYQRLDRAIIFSRVSGHNIRYSTYSAWVKGIHTNALRPKRETRPLSKERKSRDELTDSLDSKSSKFKKIHFLVQ
jgi:hypothetical protein